MLWKKNLNLTDARALSYEFCKDHDIPYCQIYYVDKVGNGNDYGQYFYIDQGHILMQEKLHGRICVLMHELTHHLECKGYHLNCGNTNESSHGYHYQLAKHKVVAWCRKNISKKPNWFKPLRAYQPKSDLVNFRL